MRSRPICFAAAAAAIAAAVGQPATLASILTWNNAAGGTANLTTNWNPNQVPTSADDLVFTLGGSYAVTFNASTIASRNHKFRQGAVTLTMSAPHTTSVGVTVGDLSGDVATATLTTGTWNSTFSFLVGDGFGASGTLNINDDDADLLINGVGADLFVGNNGDAAMSITGGGLVEVADQFILGANSASSPILTVSGATNLLPAVRSTLRVLGTSESRLGQGGDATVSIASGALAQFAGNLVVANGSASTSTVTVAGLGGILNASATLDVDGNLMLGRNSSAGTAAGIATLNVNAGGVVTVGGTLSVAGDDIGGSATLHTEGTAQITTHSLAIGDGATLDLDDGAIDIVGGAFTWDIPLTPAAINGGAGHPVVTLRNNAAASFTRVSPGGQVFTVGGGVGANFATLNVHSGSDLDLSDGISTIAAGADDEGSVYVNGAGSTLTLDPAGSALVVGDAGNGSLEIELGAAASGDNLFVGADPGSAGFALFENPGTTATFNDIYIGGNTGLAGGQGGVIVYDGAVLNMPGPSGILRVYPDGYFDVSGGIVNAPGHSVLVDGDLLFEDAGAELHAEAATILSGGRILAHPDLPGTALLDAEVLLNAGASLDLVFGDLVAGDPASPHGFSALSGSTIAIGNNTLTLLDNNGADVDNVTIAGGTLAAPDDDGIEIVNNGHIEGHGNIDGNIFYHSGGGVITATGTGITINGELRNNSGNIDGTKFTFNDNPDVTGESGWTGAGAINARVVFNSGTQVRALANMTLGANASDGVTFNLGSQLHADTRRVTLIDSNGIGLPSVTDVNTGGQIVCSQNLTANVGRRVSGRGFIETPLLTVFGRISPGELVGEPFGETGELAILGDLTISGSSAHTDIEIDGLVTPLFDRIIVSGAATLGGTLNVSFLPGLDPTQPFNLVILTAGSLSGSFNTVNLPPRTRMLTTGPQVRIIFCPADFNSSGTLSVQDIFDFLAAYFAGNPAADFNASGSTSVQDIFDFLAAYFAGCP